MNFRFFDIGLREIINEPGNEFEFYRSMVTTYINASADSSQSQGLRAESSVRNETWGASKQQLNSLFRFFLFWEDGNLKLVNENWGRHFDKKYNSDKSYIIVIH